MKELKIKTRKHVVYETPIIIDEYDLVAVYCPDGRLLDVNQENRSRRWNKDPERFKRWNERWNGGKCAQSDRA